jgi:hypothetical protein
VSNHQLSPRTLLRGAIGCGVQANGNNLS